MKRIVAYVIFLSMIFMSIGSWSEECAFDPVIYSVDIYIPAEQYRVGCEVEQLDIKQTGIQVSTQDTHQEEVYLVSNFMNAYIETSSRL